MDQVCGDGNIDTEVEKSMTGKNNKFLNASADKSALISEGQIVKPTPVFQPEDEDFDFAEKKKKFAENIVNVEKEMQTKVIGWGKKKRQKRNKSKVQGIKKERQKWNKSKVQGIKKKPLIAKLEDLLQTEAKRKEELKSRCLYVRGFPSGSPPEVFKALSSDIVNVITRWTLKDRTKYRLLEFESERKAIENYKLLQGKTINGKVLHVNLWGKKKLSANALRNAENLKQNNCSLVVKGFKYRATTEDFSALSPDILSINFLFKWGKPKLCYLRFESEQKAIENYIMLRAKKLKNKEIDVNFCGENELSEERIEEIDKMIPKIIKKRKLENEMETACYLSVRGFPRGTNEKDFKVLSPDIQSVWSSKSRYKLFRFLTFKNEQIATENYNLLQGSTINGKKLRLDFSKSRDERDSLFLAMYGFSKGTAPDDIQALSSDILDVVMPKYIPSKAGPCFVEFENELIAIKNYKLLQGKTIAGNELYVTFFGEKMLPEDLLEIEYERRKNRYARCLAVKKFPFGTTAEDFKALSSDIVDVFIQYSEKGMCGLLEFENEQKCAENYLLLQGKKVKGKAFGVNLLVGVDKGTPVAVEHQFVADPSDLQQQKKMPVSLMCEGIPVCATIGEIAHLFPKASSVIIQKESPEKEACATFYSDVDAAVAFKDNENAMICGKSIRVQFPKKRKISE